FSNWLDQEPGEHFEGRLIPEEYENSFIDRLLESFRKSVDEHGNRRDSCRSTVHRAVIEAYQGLYSLRSAYDAIQGEYEIMRTYGPGETAGEKGWTQRRADDYHAMWE